MFFRLAGGLGGVYFGWAVVSHLVRMARSGRPWILEGTWLTLQLNGALSVACWTAAGLIGLLPGILMAAGFIGLTAAQLVRLQRTGNKQGKGDVVRKRILGALRLQSWLAFAYIRDDVRAIRNRFQGGGTEADSPQAPSPAPAAVPARPQRAVPAQRAPGSAEPVPDPRTTGAVPRIREDPHLGDPGGEDAIAESLVLSGVAVPPAWAALEQYIAEFEPEDDEDLLNHIAGDAAGALAVAEAVRTRADTLLHGTGLDPAYVAGHADFADEFAGLAQAVALLTRRFHVIYGAIKDAVANGLILPHNGRWLTGGDGDAPASGSGEAAA